jgi:hypothetical protein
VAGTETHKYEFQQESEGDACEGGNLSLFKVSAWVNSVVIDVPRKEISFGSTTLPCKSIHEPNDF